MKNKIKYIFNEIWNNARQYLFVVIIKNLFTAAVPVIDVWGLGLVVNGILADKDLPKVFSIILIYTGISFMCSLLGALFTYIENVIMRKSTNTLQFGYMKDCIDIDYHYVQDRNLLDLKQKSMNARPEFFLGLWGKCINDILKVTGVLAIFTMIGPAFIIVLIILAIGIIKTNTRINKAEIGFHNDRVEGDRKIDYLYQVMTDYKYAKEVRINDVDKLISEKYDETAAGQFEKISSLSGKRVRYQILGKLLQAAQVLAVYSYFSYMVLIGNISLAEYTMAITAVTLFVSSVVSMFTNIGYVKNNFVAIDFLKQYRSIVNENSRNAKSNQFQMSRPIDFGGADIQFKDVSFTYPGAEKCTLSDLSFILHAKEKTAIVGLNGAGKSTLIMLLLRLYQPDRGTILINGVDINTIPFNEYIGRFGILLQDFSLFAYSIRENIIFDKEADEKKLAQALKQSGFEKKVNSLEKGLETSIYKELDEHGIELSGGNGQKLALARALYKNGDIMVLDEPTSSFDPIAEYEFYRQLYSMSENKTTLFVSHRLSSTVFCDNIIVLKDGRKIQEGNHEELMHRDGEYRTLFEMQAQYYEKVEKDG